MGGNSQTKSTERWQKKAGYKEFEKACKNAGVSQASQISKMMIEFIEKNQ